MKKKTLKRLQLGKKPKHHLRVVQKKNIPDSSVNTSTSKSDLSSSTSASDSFAEAVGQKPIPFQKPLLQPEHKAVKAEIIKNFTKNNFLTNPAFSDENPNADKNKEIYINRLAEQGFDKAALEK